MIEKSQILYVIYLNYVHIFKSVILQELLHILYFKIIPTISKKFDSNPNSPFSYTEMSTKQSQLLGAFRQSSGMFDLI